MGVSEEDAALSIEDGSAWLSVYNVSKLDNSAIHLLLEQTANTIQSTDLAVPSGCLRCGGADNSELMYVEGRPTRLCSICLDDAAQERHEVESDLNRASLGATPGLPGAGIFVVAGWATFWTVLDLVLEHFRVQFIEINAFTFLVLSVILGSVGSALGWPTGATLRRSIAIRKAPRAMSVFFIGAAAIGGEILYVGLYVLRLAGVFDLVVATQLLGEVLSSYSGFWIFCKLGFLAAIGFSCVLSATLRKSVRLDV